MTPMEQAIADHRQAALEARETHEKNLAAERERDRLKDALASLESNIASAEQAHANADAAQQLGETSDLAATQAALDAARKSLTDALDLKHKIRVSDLLVEKFGALALEAADKQREALAALNALWNEKLLAQLHAEVIEANRLAAEWAAAQDKATATRELFEERRLQQTGAVTGWKEEEQKDVYCGHPPRPAHEVRLAHKQALLAEIAAATQV